MIDNLKKFLNEDQDPKAIEKISNKLNDILIIGEDIHYIAVQKKPTVNLSPDCVALTNKRIIICRQKNLGLSMDLQDYLWKDIEDCSIKEGILGSDFILKTINGITNQIDYLPKSQARKLYSFAQKQEEEQIEYRRQLDLEAKRATSGNINVSSHIPQNIPQEIQSDKDDPMTSLQKLKTLYDNNLISLEDFNTKKAEILARI